MNNFDFTLEEVVRFEGETGPYVQYSHARAMSILEKADFDPAAVSSLSLADTESWEVIKLIQRYQKPCCKQQKI